MQRPTMSRQRSEQLSQVSSTQHVRKTQDLLQQVELMEYEDILRRKNRLPKKNPSMRINGLKSMRKFDRQSTLKQGHLEPSTQQSEKSEKLDMLPMLAEN